MKKDSKEEDLVQSQNLSKTFELKIINERGLHARASAKFAALVDTFESDVEVLRDGLIVPGNSIMGLLTLAAEKGVVLTVRVVGRDAEHLEKALSNLISNFFGEGK
mgnify:FL=1